MTKPRFSLWLRLVLGVLGAGAFGAGVLAVFITDNGTGSAVLLAFGGVVLVLALLGDRIDSLEFGGARLRLRAAAAAAFAEAEQSERRGDRRAADQLRVEAEALLAAAGPIAQDYRDLRRSMRGGAERTQAMTEVVDRARQLAADQDFEPAEVARWLRSGTEEERVTALGMMQARPELRDFNAMLDAIVESRSAFEQYQALRLAVAMVDDLGPDQRRRLRTTLAALPEGRLARDGSRGRLVDELLERLPHEPAP